MTTALTFYPTSRSLGSNSTFVHRNHADKLYALSALSPLLSTLHACGRTLYHLDTDDTAAVDTDWHADFSKQPDPELVMQETHFYMPSARLCERLPHLVVGDKEMLQFFMDKF